MLDHRSREISSKRFSQGFQALAVISMREIPAKRPGQFLGESHWRIWRMLLAHGNRWDKRCRFNNLVWVGGDEMLRRERHNYLTVFVDLTTKRLLEGPLGLAGV